MKRSVLQNERVVVSRMAFRARKVFGTFEKRASDTKKNFVLQYIKSTITPFRQLLRTELYLHKMREANCVFFQNPEGQHFN